MIKAILISNQGVVLGEVQVPPDALVIEYQGATFICCHMTVVNAEVSCLMFTQVQRYPVHVLNREYVMRGPAE